MDFTLIFFTHVSGKHKSLSERGSGLLVRPNKRCPWDLLLQGTSSLHFSSTTGTTLVVSLLISTTPHPSRPLRCHPTPSRPTLALCPPHRPQPRHPRCPQPSLGLLSAPLRLNAPTIQARRSPHWNSTTQPSPHVNRNLPQTGCCTSQRAR